MSIKTFEQAVKDGEIKWEVLPGEASPGKDDYDMVLILLMVMVRILLCLMVDG